MISPGRGTDSTPQEFDPLDVSDDGDFSHRALVSDAAGPAFNVMMEAVAAVPPFELFYVEHRDVVLGFLRRRLGAHAAEDAFQETFLRALRASTGSTPASTCARGC